MQSMDHSKEIHYNFYNILAIQSNLYKRKHFVFEGRENEPNMILVDGPDYKNYICKNLYIFGSNRSGVDGELLIETQCTTNYDKKIYLRFFLYTNRFVDATPIDRLMESDSNIEVNLNPVLPNNADCFYKDTEKGVIITFKTPIMVKSMFHNYVANPIEEAENEPEVVTYFRENFANLNQSIKENFSMIGPSGELIECYEGEGEEAAMGEAVKKQYDSSVENTLGLYSVLLFVIVVFIIWYLLGTIYTLIGYSVVFVYKLLGIGLPSIKTLVTIIIFFIPFTIIAYGVYLLFILMIYGENATKADLSENAGVIDRIANKTKVDRDIMIIVLCGIAGFSMLYHHYNSQDEKYNQYFNAIGNSVLGSETCENGNCNP
jgi:hypothetical protein